jgi:hypothetical protein
MTDQLMVKYKGENMTKAEREKKKLEKAQEDYVKFEESIAIIERTIIQLNTTSNESEPICRVSYFKRFDGMMTFL